MKKPKIGLQKNSLSTFEMNPFIFFFCNKPDKNNKKRADFIPKKKNPLALKNFYAIRKKIFVVLFVSFSPKKKKTGGFALPNSFFFQKKPSRKKKTFKKTFFIWQKIYWCLNFGLGRFSLDYSPIIR